MSLCLLLISRPLLAVEIINFDDIKNEIGFSKVLSLFQENDKNINVRVAIFDNGFKGVTEAIGLTLPSSTQVIEFDKISDENLEASHGYFMSQILFNLVNTKTDVNHSGVQLFLYRVTGFTNFKKAIDHSIENNIQIILHSMVRDYGSNFDGNGFFNAEVNRATDSGIIWVNAAGNFGSSTFHQNEISEHNEGWVKLPWKNQALTLDCRPPKNSEIKTCDLRLILGWNDFKDSPFEGTDKDLDLHLSVYSNNQFYDLKESQLIQSVSSDIKPGQSRYPREIIETQLNPGRYFIRVKNRSLNFDTSDSFYLTSDSEFIYLGSYSKEESLFNPADNPNVITVGASDTERSSQSLILNKPDILTPSRIELSNDEVYLGSSNAAAITAAAVTLLLSVDPSLTKDEIVNGLIGTENQVSNKSKKQSYQGSGNIDNLPCYQDVRLDPYQLSNPLIYLFNQRGGRAIQFFGKTKIMVPFSPSELVPIHFIQRRDDMIIVNPFGFFVRPRHHEAYLLFNEIEVLSKEDVEMFCQGSEEIYRKRDRTQGRISNSESNKKRLVLPYDFFKED